MIEDIRADYKTMCFAIKQRIKLDNALGAYVRLDLGWSPALPEDEAEEIRKEAAAAIKRRDARYLDVIEATELAREPFDKIEGEAIKRMERAAKKLPAWQSFGEGVRGFGAKGLAVIIGEAGDLANYATLPKLYKRLGLAPYAGKAGSTWRGMSGKAGALSAGDWEEFGYSPRRRAAMFAYVGEPIMRQGPYAEVYQERRALEDTRTDSKMTAHRRAHRYATKKLIKHLWLAWPRPDLWPLVERPDAPCPTDKAA